MTAKSCNTETASSGWVAEAGAVFLKDLTVELRSRYALNAMALFAVTTLAVVSFAIGPYALPPRALAALLWVILFFAAVASLSRSFLHEEETHTVTALRLVADPAAVLLGKLLLNLCLLLGLAALLAPLFIIGMQARVGNPGLLLLALLLGCTGLAAGCTVVAAIIARAGARSALFGGLAFPVLLPLLLTAVSATARAMNGEPLAAAGGELRLLIAFIGVMVTAALLLFEFIWNA